VESRYSEAVSAFERTIRAPLDLEQRPRTLLRSLGAPCSASHSPFGRLQVETIFAALFRSNPHLTYEREIITMPDGGVVALDSEASTDLPAEAPVLVLLPGLTGGSGDT
jgi:predicted alpha/beta-fold hydrolase